MEVVGVDDSLTAILQIGEKGGQICGLHLKGPSNLDSLCHIAVT